MLKGDKFYITWQKIRLIYFDIVGLYCFKLCFSGATRHGDARNASQIRQPHVNKIYWGMDLLSFSFAMDDMDDDEIFLRVLDST